MYWDTALIYWIQGFPSDPLPQVYKIAMQSAFTNICEKTSSTEELSEFKRGTGMPPLQ